MKKAKNILLLFLILFGKLSSAQFCDKVILMLSSSGNVDYTFDSFGKYIGGITQNGVSQLKVLVDNSISGNPNCRWNLIIYIDNNSNPVADEWETLSSYTMSGARPKINQLQVRVRNRCSTPITGNSFFNTNVVPGVPIILIQNTGVTVPAGSCITNVNGPGNYLKNYDEFTFDIDYRLIPGLNLRSGIYQLRLKYLLTE
ncbi:MAG: hypothetical protein ACHQK8_00955 [Bacteroidia bacterium]